MPVDLSDAEAAILAPLLARERRLARSNGRDLPAVLLPLAERFNAAEQRAASRPRPMVSPMEPDGFPSTDSIRWLPVTEAACRAGVTRQAVRKACRRRQLRSHRTEDGWVIAEPSLIEWRRRRMVKKQIDDLAGERTEYVHLASEITRLDNEIRVLEHERDSAEAVATAAEARSDGAVSAYRARETWHELNAKILELVERLRPIKERHRRLAELIDPFDRARDGLARQKDLVVAREKVHAGLHYIDKAIATFEAVEPELRAVGDQLPLRARKLIDDWKDLRRAGHSEPYRMGSARYGFLQSANVDDARARLHRMEAEVR